MIDKLEVRPIEEWSRLRGFANLFHKESRAWWGTRRWWLNALIWPGVINGLMANMLFVPTIASLASPAEVERAGGLTGYLAQMGAGVLFEFGAVVLAIGVIVLIQDAILGERQSGLMEWLLSQPVTRPAYLLAKLAASSLAALVLLVGLPASLGYGLLSIRIGAAFPAWPFLMGVGAMILHTLFYLTLTLALGTIFNSRAPILGLGLGSALGGALLGSLFKPLLYITPWMLPKLAALLANNQALPSPMLWAPLAAALIWSMVFIGAALLRLERMEF